jgi:formate/nitrite transporter FocA (FNT family)
MTLFFKGVLCNLLVCLAVWLAYAGRSVTDKIVALLLPVSAFIAAGFDHCVANMYFLPLAWLMTRTGNVPPDFRCFGNHDHGIIHNLVPVTLAISQGCRTRRCNVLDYLSDHLRQERTSGNVQGKER